MDIDFFNIGVAYAALLFIFTLCGVLRSIDFCTPLGKNADELYPARRIVACIYFSVVLLLPCALHPQSSDAQLLARCFWVLFIPAATALGYKRFFFGDKLHKRLRIALVGGVPVLFTLVLSCIALAGGDVLLPHKKAVIHAAGILGALLTAYGIHVMIWLFHIMSGTDTAARAADKLFPKRFALGMFGVSLVVLAVTWWVFLFKDMQANAVFAGIIALIGLLILLVILHPQRVEKEAEDGKYKKKSVPVMVAVTPNGDTVQVAMLSEADDETMVSDACCMEDESAESKNEEDEDAEDDNEEDGDVDEDTPDDTPQESTQSKEKKYTLSDAQLDNMERRIRKLVEGRRMYLYPDLKQEALEKKLGVNRSYLSEVFARRFGSFSQYINTLRIEHSIRYATEHPNAKQTEVLRRSGFGSDKSYYRVKGIYETGKSLPKSQNADNAIDNSNLQR